MVRHATYIHKSGISYAVTHSFHIICGFFFLFLSWGLVLSIQEGYSLLRMPHIFILQLFTLAGATFRDSWVFNTKSQNITSIYGFGPLCKREVFDFEEVERLELTHFIRGKVDTSTQENKRRFRAMILFSLRLSEDRIKDIEIIAEKASGGKTEAAFSRIGAVTGLPLFMDRPRDMDLHVTYHENRWQIG